MKIAIDISQIIYGTGVSVYTREFVSNLLKIDTQNQYLLFGGSLRRREELKKYGAKVIPLSPALADFVWNRLHIINIEKFIGPIDVLHSSDWTQPPTDAFKVTTIHDLAPLKFPKETPKKIVDVHKRRLYWVMKEVDRIIVPTNSIKNDLVEFGVKENKIRVIYEGVGEKFKKQIGQNNNNNNYGDYIMTVGNGERKNTKRLIEAFQKIKRDNLKLVIVGGNKNNDFESRGVIYTGYVTDEELINLYSGASAMVYPSLYEGFGLPIIQAMKCECPVVTSNTGAMKEVSGGAGILVDPYDVASISEGIQKALIGPKSWIKKGVKRAEIFDWTKAASQTLEVYKEREAEIK